MNAGGEISTGAGAGAGEGDRSGWGAVGKRFVLGLRWIPFSRSAIVKSRNLRSSIAVSRDLIVSLIPNTI